MKRSPILIYSDPHYHNFSQFATTNSDGINSRLASTIKATHEAVDTLLAKGGNVMFCAGDLFHVRGSVAPSVLNPIKQMFEEISAKGVWIFLLSGNHDLESDSSKELTSAITSLDSLKINVVSKHEGECFYFDEMRIKMVPWNPKLDEIRKHIADDSDLDPVAVHNMRTLLFLHAPMNGVVTGLPDHGLTVSDWDNSPYDATFIGHYHNHKVFENGSRKIVSVGALTHQNWGDVDAKAGFVLYYPDDNRVEHFESSAPKFLKVDIDDIDHADVVDNFIKVVGGEADPVEAQQIRNDLIIAGARGVIVEGLAKKPTVTRTGTISPSTAPTIHSILGDYIDRNYPGDLDVKVTAIEILGEIYD